MKIKNLGRQQGTFNSLEDETEDYRWRFHVTDQLSIPLRMKRSGAVIYIRTVNLTFNSFEDETIIAIAITLLARRSFNSFEDET